MVVEHHQEDLLDGVIDQLHPVILMNHQVRVVGFLGLHTDRGRTHLGEVSVDPLCLLKLAHVGSSTKAGQSHHSCHHIKLANGHTPLQSTNE